MAGSAPLPQRKCCCGAAAEGGPGLLGLLGAPPPHVAGDQTDVWPRAPHHLALVPGAVHSARKGAGASFRGAASPSPGPPREARGVGVLGGGSHAGGGRTRHHGHRPGNEIQALGRRQDAGRRVRRAAGRREGAGPVHSGQAKLIAGGDGGLLTPWAPQGERGRAVPPPGGGRPAARLLSRSFSGTEPTSLPGGRRPHHPSAPNDLASLRGCSTWPGVHPNLESVHAGRPLPGHTQVGRRELQVPPALGTSPLRRLQGQPPTPQASRGGARRPRSSCWGQPCEPPPILQGHRPCLSPSPAGREPVLNSPSDQASDRPPAGRSVPHLLHWLCRGEPRPGGPAAHVSRVPHLWDAKADLSPSTSGTCSP